MFKIFLFISNIVENECKYIKESLYINWVSSTGSYVISFEKISLIILIQSMLLHLPMLLYFKSSIKLCFSQKAANNGIERVTEAGKMPIYGCCP